MKGSILSGKVGLAQLLAPLFRLGLAQAVRTMCEGLGKLSPHAQVMASCCRVWPVLPIRFGLWIGGPGSQCQQGYLGFGVLNDVRGPCSIVTELSNETEVVLW